MSNVQPKSRIIHIFKKFAYFAAFITILTGCTALIGWAFDIATLKNVFPGFITMKANTAFGFILSGTALWGVLKGKEKSLMVLLPAVFTLLLGILNLSEYIFGIDLNIDQLLFKDTGTPWESYPGRMAVPTAFNFSLIGISFLLLRTPSLNIQRHIPQGFTLIGLVIALVTLIGYIFGTPYLAWLGSYGSIALHTALAFIFLTTGILAAQPSEGFMAALTADTIGGMATRQFLPAAIAVPLTLGYVRLWGQKQGFYGTEFGVALLVSSSMLVFTVLTWINARSLDKIDRERRRLEGMEGRLRQILESAPDAMIVVNTQGRMVFVNSQAEHLFGYTREQMLEKPVEILMPEQFRAKHTDYRQGFLKTPARRDMGIGLELWGLHKNGSSIPIEIALSPLETDEEMRVIAAVRDMSEHKRNEEAILRLNKDLQHHAAQLEIANKELEAFSYSVSHDLRTPLRAMNGFARILEEEHGHQLDDEGRRLLNIVRGNTQKMGCLIDNLLEFSRMGRHKLQCMNVDVFSLVQAVFEELQQPNPSANIQFCLEPLLPANGDRALLRQVWTNLLSNAIKYSKTRALAVIKVSSRQNDNEIIYSISDNGVGFDMRYVHKLFGVFQRLHEQREFEGTGVGLAIAQRIIQRHGGRIWAEGRPNDGATFHFSLPINT